MPPTLRFADLRPVSVGVWGVGVEGRATLRRLAADGVAVAAVVDDRAGVAPDGRSVIPLAAGGLEALSRCEVVVKSPGISRYRREVVDLERAGVAVVGGLGLWLEGADRGRVVCVTGTKGKSTTSAVAGHLAAGLGRRCLIGGNIGRPPWDPEVPTDTDLWVVETSSFQATDVTSSPPVVAVTSLHPDHLDWHGDVATYYADKLSLCSRPGAELTVVNGDDPVLRARRGSLGPRVEWVGADDAGAWAGHLGLLGRHNRANALIAAACLRALGVAGADDDDALARAAGGFTGLPSRLHLLAEVDGVAFVDDSLSTNVLPTLAALSVYPQRAVALLVGGHDRHIDYEPLAEHLRRRRAPTLVLALPDSGARVVSALGRSGEGISGAGDAPAGGPGADPGGVGHGGDGAAERLWVESHDDLAEAVSAGWTWARRRGGVVLLSPAAASFGRFSDYAERSAVFAAAVAACTGAGPERATGTPMPRTTPS